MDRKRGQKPSRGMCKAFHEACKSNYDAMHLKCRAMCQLHLNKIGRKKENCTYNFAYCQTSKLIQYLKKEREGLKYKEELVRLCDNLRGNKEGRESKMNPLFLAQATYHLPR